LYLESWNGSKHGLDRPAKRQNTLSDKTLYVLGSNPNPNIFDGDNKAEGESHRERLSEKTS